MSTHTFGLIELIGTFGLILGVLGWQWLSIRRELKRDAEKKAGEDRPPEGGPRQPDGS